VVAVTHKWPASRLLRARYRCICHFDVAFIDVNPRGVPAWPLANVLRARGIPFAFVSGDGSAGAAAARAAVPVLQKPFRVQDLEAVLPRLRSQ
jgi:hypothetical protein